MQTSSIPISPLAGTTAVVATASASGSATAVATPAGYAFAVVLKVPVPILQLNLNILGDFILPALNATGIPKAVLWLVENAAEEVQDIVDIASELIAAIPNLTVSIILQVGSVSVISLQLVAEKVPVTIPIPTFELALPNLAVGFDIPMPPVLANETVAIPIPVPVVQLPSSFVEVSGGQVSAQIVSGSSIGAQPVTDPVRLPVL